MLKITLIAFGDKMPKWVDEAAKIYMQRLQEYVQLKCIALPIEKRQKSQAESVYMEREAKKLEQSIPSNAYLIAMDSHGMSFTSENLAVKLERLQLIAPHLCLIMGGPDGICSSLLKKAQEKWSLSSLTFPHPLARVILLEALYRAFSILHDHPYHK